MDVTAALQSVLLLDRYPNTEIDVRIDIWQADGNEKAAAINAAVLALADAHIAMRDIVVAVAAAHVNGDVLADPTTAERPAVASSMTLATLAHDASLIAFIGTAGLMTEDVLDRLHGACAASCKALAAATLPALRQAVEARVALRQRREVDA